jgi:hypothetical protein
MISFKWPMHSAARTFFRFLHFFVINEFVYIFLGFGFGHGDEFLDPQDGFSHFQENIVDVGGQSGGSLSESDLEFVA